MDRENRNIWDDPSSCFMETVHLNVKRLSETEGRFTYDDVHDEYFIQISE